MNRTQYLCGLNIMPGLAGSAFGYTIKQWGDVEDKRKLRLAIARMAAVAYTKQLFSTVPYGNQL